MMAGGAGVSGAEDEVLLESVSMLLADACSPEELVHTRLLCQIIRFLARGPLPSSVYVPTALPSAFPYVSD